MCAGESLRAAATAQAAGIAALVDAGLWRPTPARVAAWRAGLAAADSRTGEARGFWDGYVERVARALVSL